MNDVHLGICFPLIRAPNYSLLVWVSLQHKADSKCSNCNKIVVCDSFAQIKVVICWNVCVLLTHVELAEQLKPCMPLCRSDLRCPIRLIQLEDCLLDVSLGHHAMPLVVIEGCVRMHCQLHRSVSDIEGEGDDFRSYRESVRQRNTQFTSIPNKHQNFLKPITPCLCHSPLCR